ncbi:winged helix-turn-helix domain-containing protein [Erwinia sp. D4-22]
MVLRSEKSAEAQHLCQPEDLLAATAAIMADKSRARMLCVLMDGRAWTATELSAAADISASTASAHLAKLAGQGFVVCLAQGRHRYYRLSSAAVADLLERLMEIAWAGQAAPRITTPAYLRRARTCYDHLAGEVAVSLYQRLTERGWLTEEGSALTTQGSAMLAELGIAVAPAGSRRKFSCACLDWSERRYHLGGALGAALLSWFEQQRWMEKDIGSRCVRITAKGAQGLKRHFGVQAV